MVTGFLGPNGAGKSTTMRMILGLDRPTAGSVTVNGKAYRDHAAPLREVGAMLEARAIHTGRSAYNHLLALAQTHGIPRAASTRSSTSSGCRRWRASASAAFSLGMGQRLGIAAALLGDPKTLILDEPSNGLDPEGIRWIRKLLRVLAAEGRTVFVSSHLMSEMSMMADWLIVVGRGRLIADTTVEGFVQLASGDGRARAHARRGEAALAGVRRSTASPSRTRRRRRIACSRCRASRARQSASSPRRTPSCCTSSTPEQASLEEAFMRLTQDAVEYHAAPTSDETAVERPDERRRQPPARERAAPCPASRSAASSRSEWTKLWSLRSTRWSLLVVRGRDGRPRHPGLRRADGALEPDELRRPRDLRPGRRQPRRLAPGTARDRRARRAADHGRVLDGQIRSTFAAVPRRLPVLWAKAGVYAADHVRLMVAASFIAFLVSQPILRQHHVDTTLSSPHVLRAVIGAALFLTVTGLLGVSLGALVRNTAGGIATFAGLMFVLPGSRRSSRTAGATASIPICRSAPARTS